MLTHFSLRAADSRSCLAPFSISLFLSRSLSRTHKHSSSFCVLDFPRVFLLSSSERLSLTLSRSYFLWRRSYILFNPRSKYRQSPFFFLSSPLSTKRKVPGTKQIGFSTTITFFLFFSVEYFSQEDVLESGGLSDKKGENRSEISAEAAGTQP